MRSRSKGARRAATSVTVVSMAASLVGCADTPAMPLSDVFHTESVAAESTMDPPGYVEAAVSLDSCVLASPGVIDVTGQINLGITGVADDAAAVSQLVIEVLLGDSRVRGVLTGSVDGTGSFLATFPVEEIQGTDSAVVVESYIGDPGEFVARCHASLLTRAVTFLPADPIELVPAPGVTPRTG
jgi:hypothetical protein